MSTKQRIVAGVLTVALGWVVSHGNAEAASAPLQVAGSCAEAEFDQLQSRTRAFHEEAQRQALDFAVDSGVGVAIGDAKAIVLDRTTPLTLARAREVEFNAARIRAQDTLLETLQVTSQTLLDCLLGLGNRCNVTEFIKKQDQAVQRWIESMMSEGTQTALGRAREANNLLKNWVAQSAGTAIGSTRAALNCMNEYVQRAQAAGSGTVDLADAPAPPPGQRPAAGGGPSAGKIVGIGLGAAGAVVAGVMAAGQVSDLADGASPAPVSTPSSTPTGGGVPATGASGTYRAQVTRSCTPPPGPATGQASCVIAFGSSSSPCPNPELFNFTVANGSITNQCWLNDAPITSGSYTGRYRGSAFNGVPVSGPLPTSTGQSTTWRTLGGAFVEGGTHVVTLVITKIQ